MIKHSLAAALLSALVAAPAFAAPVEYTMDPNHTQVRFGWTHFGFSKLEGMFEKVSGTFVYDPQNVAGSSVNASIDLTGIDTGVDKLNEHLATPDFFDVAKFGTATYKSTKVSAAGEGKLTVEGELTLHGVTKPVTLDVTVNNVGPHGMTQKPSAGFDATATLTRSDFGIDKYVPNVSDEIRLEITTEATDSKVAKKAA
jgi:polyisoprenoid-binding protein YceI